jgi:primary-amine oxidase
MESRTKPWLFISSGLLAIAVITFLLYPLRHESSAVEYAAQHKKAFVAPKHNVWAELSADEATTVNDFILEHYKDLNLTAKPSKSARDANFIHIVESLRPNKTDAISYLYNNGTIPERWAKAAVSQNFPDGPYSK